MRHEFKSVARLRSVPAIAATLGAGARDPGCKNGPAAFEAHADAALREQGLMLSWHRMPPQDGACRSPLDAVAGAARWIAGLTRPFTAARERFLVIGGDHSCAIGTWSGAADALRPAGALGLIWIDAHMDMHVPDTTHSGAINGMPVAALLGHGAPQLTGVATTGPALDPRHVCVVGARSFEPEEVAFAERLGVRVIGMPEVERRGVAAVLTEAKSIASQGTAAYGVSLDLDAFDPADAPGVGTPAPHGIRATDFAEPWATLTRDPACLGVEIVEYNPARDVAGRTARLMQSLVLSLDSSWAA